MMPLTDKWEENDDPAFEGCYEYDEAEYYQNTKIEEQVGSESNQNPQRRKRKGKFVRSLLMEVRCNETISMEN